MSTLVPKESYYGNYYYYTDGCTDFTFIIFEETLSISEDQLNTLRLLDFSLLFRLNYIPNHAILVRQD